MSYFDRFDLCEAYNVWAHDWGEYNAIARLRWMGFHPGAMRDTYNALTDNGRAMYDELNARSEADPEWYARRLAA